MKKAILLLSLLLLLPVTAAAENEYSDWAKVDAQKALALGLPHRYIDRDFRTPINRGEFAEKAASLVAIEFGSNLQSYLLIQYAREHGASSEYIAFPQAVDVAKSLGIIQGRGDDDWDFHSDITRQEAAVMLARTYRAYQDDLPDTLTPLSFADQEDIADWALEDVQLMNHLGIMTGVEGSRFDPLGSYTYEQCLVTLLRLHEKAPYDGGKESPFPLPPMPGFICLPQEFSNLVFAFETEEYYIVSLAYLTGHMGGVVYYIEVIDPDLTRRQYRTAIIETDNQHYGPGHARPEQAWLSEDGATLFYTATLEEDVYYNGSPELGSLIWRKGVYMVTMDLSTGEQTYERADLGAR